MERSKQPNTFEAFVLAWARVKRRWPGFKVRRGSLYSVDDAGNPCGCLLGILAIDRGWIPETVVDRSEFFDDEELEGMYRRFKAEGYPGEVYAAFDGAFRSDPDRAPVSLLALAAYKFGRWAWEALNPADRFDTF